MELACDGVGGACVQLGAGPAAVLAGEHTCLQHPLAHRLLAMMCFLVHKLSLHITFLRCFRQNQVLRGSQSRA